MILVSDIVLILPDTFDCDDDSDDYCNGFLHQFAIAFEECCSNPSDIQTYVDSHTTVSCASVGSLGTDEGSHHGWQHENWRIGWMYETCWVEDP